MDDPFTISLVVSGIGMLMLFLALALLYGLMVLMTRMRDIRRITGIWGPIGAQGEAGAGEQRGRGAEGQGARGTEQEARRGKRQAAVIGVALARAERELMEVGAAGREGASDSWYVSPWRALHHQRRLTLSLRMRRGR